MVGALLAGSSVALSASSAPSEQRSGASPWRRPRPTTTITSTTTRPTTTSTLPTTTSTLPTTTSTSSTTSPAVTTTSSITSTTAVGPGPQPVGNAGNWSLILDDEFAQDPSLDTELWTPYWFVNGGIQNGTKMEASNVAVKGGELDLTLARNGTGALVSSNPDDGVAGHAGFQFTYGFAEARIYLPGLAGVAANWAAFWTDGQNWPADGEMDIMETLNGRACFHFHSASGSPGGCAAGDYSGWHTFGAEWDPAQVTFYYDGHDVGTISQGITGAPMYLVLENSKSGSYGGPTLRPATVQVSYVRVWSKG